MITGTHRPSKVLIDETAILHNIQHAKAQLKDDTQLFAVIKADAYGHGLLRVARVTQAAGATGFCVAILDEALALREADYTIPILVLGIISPETAAIAATQTISVPVGSKAWLEAALPVLQANPDQPRLRIHFALDTGMGRIGFREVADLIDAVDYVKAHSQWFEIEGIFTHFATADEVDTTYFNSQVDKFHQYLAALPERPKYVHVSNSATSLWHAACNGNMIRFGVALYGLNPSGRAIPETPYQLEPALQVVSELVFSKMIHAGDAVSYGATYHAKQDEWIGTVPMGYADGWLRRLQGFHVLVDGHFCEIVGRVCMDQFMIRLPKDYAPGTPVVLVGTSGDAKITLQDVADYSDTIHYEIACSLAERLPRESINPIK
ncbi:alanine racemase [Lacticaseibacillus saniviri]